MMKKDIFGWITIEIALWIEHGRRTGIICLLKVLSCNIHFNYIAEIQEHNYAV